MSESLISPNANVAESAILSDGVVISDNAVIGGDVFLGYGCKVGEMSDIADYSRLGSDVIVGPDVTIYPAALILAGTQVCPNPVRQHSSDARKLLSFVTIGEEVLLHDEVELGLSAIVPNQRTIAMIGNLGSNNRVVTIYGSDEGPRFSIGCQIGVDYDTVCSRVAGHTETDAPSASTYDPYLGIFNAIGAVVQTAYDREANLVAELKALRAELDMPFNYY
jgi:carbonic anhydrase/acetyltransferase-like protein (isoleucine patch superfamily)